MGKKLESVVSSIGQRVAAAIISIANGCWERYSRYNKLKSNSRVLKKINRILEARKKIGKKAYEIRLEKEVSKLTFQNQLLKDRIRRVEKRSNITIKQRPPLVIEDEFGDEEATKLSDDILIRKCDLQSDLGIGNPQLEDLFKMTDYHTNATGEPKEYDLPSNICGDADFDSDNDKENN